MTSSTCRSLQTCPFGRGLNAHHWQRRPPAGLRTRVATAPRGFLSEHCPGRVWRGRPLCTHTCQSAVARQCWKITWLAVARPRPLAGKTRPGLGRGGRRCVWRAQHCPPLPLRLGSHPLNTASPRSARRAFLPPLQRHSKGTFSTRLRRHLFNFPPNRDDDRQCGRALPPFPAIPHPRERCPPRPPASPSPLPFKPAHHLPLPPHRVSDNPYKQFTWFYCPSMVFKV